MVRYRNRNYALDAAFFSVALSEPTTKRELIYAAVRQQLDDDEKRPWSLSQKLRDGPYRYTRDELWASLNSISQALAASNPGVVFGVEEDFSHPSGSTFATFVNKRLGGTVSELINQIVDASRWAQ